MSSKSIGESIYDDTASFGRMWALISAVIATIIGLALIIGGIYLLFKKDAHGTLAKIVKIDGDDYGRCQIADSINNNTNYSCVLTVQYKLNGVEISEDIPYYGSTPYIVGNTVEVKDHKLISTPIPKWAAGLIIAVAFIMIGAAWFWVWASRKYKVAAAAEGVSGMWNIIKS